MGTVSFGEEYNPDTIELVKFASDLSGTLSSDICYLIDGKIDMLGQSITVPADGLNLMGCGFNVSRLIDSTTNAVLFIDGGIGGDLFLTAMEVEVTGTGAKVFDVTNSGTDAIEFNQVNFIDCTSMGSLTDYRQLLARNVAIINPQDGLEFIGAWSGGVAIVDTIALNVPAGVTMFKAGAGFLVGSSFRSNMNAISIDDTAIVFDFADTNFTPDGSFTLDNFRTNPNSNAIPNITGANVKAKFTSCSGIRNTYVGGEYAISAQAATSFISMDTLVKMAGVTTYKDLQWFSGSNDNEFQYDSTLEIEVEIKAVLSFSGTNLNEVGIQIRQWDDSASSYIEIGSEFSATLNAAGRAENSSFQGIAVLEENDRIEVWIKNIAATVDITALDGGSVIISERAP